MSQDIRNWIWCREWPAENKNRAVLVLFRKTIDLEFSPTRAELRISADSRYKLYVNGRLVVCGPSRGDAQIWYYDEPDLLPYLHKGRNVLAVEVLRYPLIHLKGNHGIFRTEHPGLYVRGAIVDTEGKHYDVCAGEDWKGQMDRGFSIVSEDPVFAPLQIFEDRRPERDLQGWRDSVYDDSSWPQAITVRNIPYAVSPGNLHARTIPYLTLEQKKFHHVSAIRQSMSGADTWDAMLEGRNAVRIPSDTREVVEITSDVEETGYIHLMLTGGRGSVIRLLYSECYMHRDKAGGLSKNRRIDPAGGVLQGFSDVYHVEGSGRDERPEIYDPFWFRTFRFIRIEIETGKEPLEIQNLCYTKTAYPLDEFHGIHTCDPSLEKIWDISERTLRNCMHETYEDCPFYEQLQYAMDSRLEILYTYATTGDDRLARKCIDDFRRSQRYDGQLNCSYPNFGPNLIPGFSIYYICMLHDHMMYFGDKEFIRNHMPCVEGILLYFHRHLTPGGYVGKLGGLNGHGAAWSFIDWTPEWNATTGVPDAILEGPITMESLLYIYGLEKAADLAEWIGHHEQARAYTKEKNAVQTAVLRYCTGKNGMIQDGPGVEKYSQHPQVFAILTGTGKSDQAKINLIETMNHPERYAQCSVAMAYYLFRALELTGLYQRTDQYWNIWRRMLEMGASTCVEDDVTARSDCHGWGSLILYELPCVTLGVRPAEPGYASARVAPVAGYLTGAEGSVKTPAGMIHVRWSTLGNGSFSCTGPEGMKIEIDRKGLQKN